jgi:protein TonB
MLLCVAAALLIVIATVKLWPLPSGERPLADLYSNTGQEVIEIAEVIPTRQEKRQPPPPAPLPPIEVADEDLIEYEDLELDSPIASTETGEDITAVDATDDDSAPLPRSQIQAKLVRFAPPRYPDEARRRKIRAEILVEVDVDERGVVQNARIIRRYLLGKDESSKELVDTLGFGLEESAVEAAMASQYRPARENGRPVRSLMEFYVTFGT